MGLLWGLLTFMTHLVCGNSNYHEDSIEWCDKVWRSMRNTERGEARLCQIEDKLYRQLYVVLDDDIEGYFTDSNDHGCNVEKLNMKRARQKELERIGHVVIKRYK